MSTFIYSVNPPKQLVTHHESRGKYLTKYWAIWWT